MRIAIGIAAISIVAGSGPARAGACGRQVVQFEAFVRRAPSGPNGGPAGPQSVAAQLDRQPTPASVRRARAKARALFRSMLVRARMLDAAGRQAECRKVLANARLVYGLK